MIVVCSKVLNLKVIWHNLDCHLVSSFALHLALQSVESAAVSGNVIRANVTSVLEVGGVAYHSPVDPPPWWRSLKFKIISAHCGKHNHK